MGSPIPWLARAQRWRPRTSDPLRIRAWLASPIAWDGRDPITIEGALQFVVVIRETGQLPDDVFAHLPRTIDADIPVPIDDVVIDSRLIACASWGQPPTCAVEGLRFRRKRARAEHYGVNKVVIGGGWGKSLNLPIATLVTPWLDFYVRGDRELLEDLLRDVSGLGRDAPRGLGAIFGFEVEPDAEDRSLLYRSAPQRALPIELDGGVYDPRTFAPGAYEERECATRAPYWHPRSRARCVVPMLRIGAGAEAA